MHNVIMSQMKKCKYLLIIVSNKFITHDGNYFEIIYKTKK